MVELAFRAYNDGENLVAVAFPADGGGAVLRKSWSFDSLGLSCAGTPPAQQEMPYDVFSVEKRKDLERGGLDVTVDYESERIEVTPLTRQGNPLESRTVRYTFETFGVEDTRESPIQKAKAEASLHVSKDAQPLSDDTWP